MDGVGVEVQRVERAVHAERLRERLRALVADQVEVQVEPPERIVALQAIEKETAPALEAAIIGLTLPTCNNVEKTFLDGQSI